MLPPIFPPKSFVSCSLLNSPASDVILLLALPNKSYTPLNIVATVSMSIVSVSCTSKKRLVIWFISIVTLPADFRFFFNSSFSFANSPGFPKLPNLRFNTMAFAANWLVCPDIVSAAALNVEYLFVSAVLRALNIN